MTATLKLDSRQLAALGSIFTQGVEHGTKVMHTLPNPALTLLVSGDPEFGVGDLPPSIHPGIPSSIFGMPGRSIKTFRWVF